MLNKFSVMKLSLLGLSVVLAGCSSSDDDDGIYGPSTPTYSNFQEAAIVIGQADFRANSTPVTSATSAKKGGGPIAYFVSPEAAPHDDSSAVRQLILPISGENRTLIYDGVPIVNQASAQSVLGQPNLNSANPSTTQKGLHSPAAVAIGAVGNSRIILVSDRENNRILGFSQHLPLTAGSKDVSADKVIGQIDFLNKTSLCTAKNFNQPSGITVTKKGEMLVADTKHHRVLIFNKIPTAAAGETDADAVLGASAFTTCPNVNSGSGAAGFKNPTAVWTDGKTLIVADTGHHRLLVWNNFDFTKPAASASFAIGQESLTNIGANQGSNLGAQTTPTASTLSLESPNNFNYTSFDVSPNGALCVPDTGNNRVLIWRRLPTTSGVAADVVLGQDSFNRWAQWDDDQDESPDAEASARTLYAPVACKFIDNKLIVADAGTNRYLVFEAK